MHEQAIPYLHRAVKLRSNFLQAIRELALSNLWTGRYSQAKANFEHLLKINPRSLFAKRGMADLMSWTGSRNEAIKIYKEIDNLEPRTNQLSLF